MAVKIKNYFETKYIYRERERVQYFKIHIGTSAFLNKTYETCLVTCTTTRETSVASPPPSQQTTAKVKAKHSQVQVLALPWSCLLIRNINFASDLYEVSYAIRDEAVLFGSVPAREDYTGPPFLAVFSGLDLAARPDYAALFEDTGAVFRSTVGIATFAATATAAAYCLGTCHVGYDISPVFKFGLGYLCCWRLSPRVLLVILGGVRLKSRPCLAQAVAASIKQEILLGLHSRVPCPFKR